MSFSRMHSIFPFLLIGMLTFGCGGLPQRPDPSGLPELSLFDNPECDRGCWRDLRPGITDQQTVEGFFAREIEFPLYHSGITREGKNWYQRGSSGRSDEYFTSATVLDNVLEQVWLAGPFKLTIAQVVGQLGEPPIVTSVFSGYGDLNALEVHVELHYPQHGYSFVTMFWVDGDIETLQACRQPDDVIYDVHVFPIVATETYLNQEQGRARRPARILAGWLDNECVKIPR